MGRGKTIQIFLPDGSANWIKLAEKHLQMKKYYQILGLEKGASKQEVQDAYDKLSVELDPKNHDQNKNFWNYALLIISKTTDEIKRK